jgi:hypothetical protein
MNPLNPLRTPRNMKLRRRGNLCFTVFAFSVTTCFASRLKILTPSSALIAIKAEPDSLHPLTHPILYPI